jgi:hypothetical protein
MVMRSVKLMRIGLEMSLERGLRLGIGMAKHLMKVTVMMTVTVTGWMMSLDFGLVRQTG